MFYLFYAIKQEKNCLRHRSLHLRLELQDPKSEMYGKKAFLGGARIHVHILQKKTRILFQFILKNVRWCFLRPLLIDLSQKKGTLINNFLYFFQFVFNVFSRLKFFFFFTYSFSHASSATFKLLIIIVGLWEPGFICIELKYQFCVPLVYSESYLKA